MGTLRQTVIAGFSVAAMTVACSVVAHAQISLSNAGSSTTDFLTEDNWTITLTGCSYAGSGTSPCSASSDDMLETVSTTHGTEFELYSTSSSGNVISAAAGTTDDLTLSIKLTQNSTPSLTLDSISAAVAASTGTPTADLGDITTALTVTPSGGSAYPTDTFSAASTGSPLTFAPTSMITLTENVKLVAPSGTSLSLASVKTAAPEPATLAVLTPAVLALLRARKSKKRQRAASV